MSWAFRATTYKAQQPPGLPCGAVAVSEELSFSHKRVGKRQGPTADNREQHGRAHVTVGGVTVAGRIWGKARQPRVRGEERLYALTMAPHPLLPVRSSAALALPCGGPLGPYLLGELVCRGPFLQTSSLSTPSRHDHLSECPVRPCSPYPRPRLPSIYIPPQHHDSFLFPPRSDLHAPRSCTPSPSHLIALSLPDRCDRLPSPCRSSQGRRRVP